MHIDQSCSTQHFDLSASVCARGPWFCVPCDLCFHTIALPVKGGEGSLASALPCSNGRYVPYMCMFGCIYMCVYMSVRHKLHVCISMQTTVLRLSRGQVLIVCAQRNTYL